MVKPIPDGYPQVTPYLIVDRSGQFEEMARRMAAMSAG